MKERPCYKGMALFRGKSCLRLQKHAGCLEKWYNFPL
jgi:hypothetical protein